MVAPFADAKPRARDAAAWVLSRAGITRPERAFRGALAIATFHRVLPEPARARYAFPGLAVTPEELDFCLGLFARHFTPGPLAEVHARWAGGERPERPLLAITFDDGQRDNFVYGREVLERHGVRATFFVTTDAVDGGGPLWHDRVGFAAAALGARDPERLRVLLGGRPLEAALERAKRLPTPAREAWVDRVERAAGEVTRPAWDAIMSWDEVRALAAEGHEIGSHAATHPILPRCDDARLERELAGSRARLAAELGHEVAAICYPNGDADARTRAAARAAGYRLGVTTRWGANAPGADPLALARWDIASDALRAADGRLSPERLALRFRWARVPDASADAAPTRRVAYLTSQYPAPSHTFIRREVDALRAEGVPVETFSVRPPAPEEIFGEREQRAVDETFYVLPPKPAAVLSSIAGRLARRPRAFVRTAREALRHRPPGVRGAAYAAVYFAEAMHLARELEARGVEHLHNHFANPAAIVGHLASSYLDLDWSFTIHGISEFDYPAGLLLGDKIRHASFVACVSDFGRAQAFRTVEPAHHDKLGIVRCGVDLAAMPARRPRPAGAPFRFVCVARLSPEKAHLGLLAAFAEVLERGIDAELVLVGEGPERGAIEARVAALPAPARVRLVGHARERAALEHIAEADALVVSSLMEGLPVVLMEAMAIGVPVVAPLVGGIPELVENDVTGLGFTVSNWPALARQMARLATDRALGDRLAAEGRRRIEAEFDVRVAVHPLLARFGAPRAAEAR